MDAHLIVLNESYPMNTSMKGFEWFSKNFKKAYLNIWAFLNPYAGSG